MLIKFSVFFSDSGRIYTVHLQIFGAFFRFGQKFYRSGKDVSLSERFRSRIFGVFLKFGQNLYDSLANFRCFFRIRAENFCMNYSQELRELHF